MTRYACVFLEKRLSRRVWKREKERRAKYRSESLH